MRKLLWVGDAACPTGFARITHEVLNILRKTWDVSVLGLNHFGDPHTYPYPIYPAIKGFSGDSFGIRRLPEVLARVQPDVVFIQNDPWNIPAYMKTIQASEIKPKATMAALAVDGLNCRGDALVGLDLAVFWTQFGLREARLGGYSGPAAIIPLGVSLDHFDRRDRVGARVRLGIPQELARRSFIVGSVGRNQPRKRLDLTLEYFADWIHGRDVRDAWLWLHVGPTGDSGHDLKQLARYYKVLNRLVLVEPPVGIGVTEDAMADTYNAFDVHITTSMNEGWHFPTLEAMACGVPNVVTGWAALSEWPEDAAIQIPCPTRSATPSNINAIGGVPDKDSFIEALDRLYRSPELREDYGNRGYELARRPDFDWANIGEDYAKVIDDALALKAELNEAPAAEEAHA